MTGESAVALQYMSNFTPGGASHSVPFSDLRLVTDLLILAYTLQLALYVVWDFESRVRAKIFSDWNFHSFSVKNY